MTTKKTHWGEGREQILACSQMIKNRFQKGWTIRKVYRHLQKAGKLTISESAFYHDVKKLKLCPVFSDLIARTTPKVKQTSNKLDDVKLREIRLKKEHARQNAELDRERRMEDARKAYGEDEIAEVRIMMIDYSYKRLLDSWKDDLPPDSPYRDI